MGTPTEELEQLVDGIYGHWLTKDELRSAITSYSKALEADARRIDGLQEMIRACPHSVITFNDDEDVEDDHGPVPVGFSIRIDGCEPLEAAADNLRATIDAALSKEATVPREGEV